MPIICVTNLSPDSVRAASAAAALTVRLKVPLVLYGVMEHDGPDAGGAHARASLQERLEREAQRLRALGTQVRTVLTSDIEEALGGTSPAGAAPRCPSAWCATPVSRCSWCAAMGRWWTGPAAGGACRCWWA
jgi:hypothetical protein